MTDGVPLNRKEHDMSISDRLDEIQGHADAATDAVNEELGDTIYACSRDHSAWGHGTMGLDDFYLACHDSTIAESLVSATANADVSRLVAALRNVLYVSEDEFPSRDHDIDYQQGVIDALLRVKKSVESALGETLIDVLDDEVEWKCDE